MLPTNYVAAGLLKAGGSDTQMRVQTPPGRTGRAQQKVGRFSRSNFRELRPQYVDPPNPPRVGRSLRPRHHRPPRIPPGEGGKNLRHQSS